MRTLLVKDRSEFSDWVLLSNSVLLLYKWNRLKEIFRRRLWLDRNIYQYMLSNRTMIKQLMYVPKRRRCRCSTGIVGRPKSDTRNLDWRASSQCMQMIARNIKQPLGLWDCAQLCLLQSSIRSAYFSLPKSGQSNHGQYIGKTGYLFGLCCSLLVFTSIIKRFGFSQTKSKEWVKVATNRSWIPVRASVSEEHIVFNSTPLTKSTKVSSMSSHRLKQTFENNIPCKMYYRPQDKCCVCPYAIRLVMRVGQNSAGSAQGLRRTCGEFNGAYRRSRPFVLYTAYCWTIGNGLGLVSFWCKGLPLGKHWKPGGVYVTSTERSEYVIVGWSSMWRWRLRRVQNVTLPIQNLDGA